MSEEICPVCGAAGPWQVVTNCQRCGACGHQTPSTAVQVPRIERRQWERPDDAKFVASLVPPQPVSSFIQPRKKK